jgi:hypothetical protein
MYALAASAAGVGVLALAQPAEAKIVYTKAHRVFSTSKEFFIDLNHDGIHDFGFTWSVFGTEHHTSSVLRIDARQNSFVNSNKFCAAALPPGVEIGPKQQFQNKLGDLYDQRVTHFTSTTTKSYCPWKAGTSAYLGLKFAINGKTHFGWARVKSEAFKGDSILLGYAYETIANKPIVAGRTRGPDTLSSDASTAVASPAKPATLGTLATGANGLSAWRRKESVPGAEEGN